jgi:MFS family permease
MISMSVAFQAAAICITAWLMRGGLLQKGLRFATILSVASSAIVFPVTYFVSEVWVFIFLRTLFGVCITASIVSAEYLVTLRAKETQNAHVIACFTASVGVGALFGPALISLAGVNEMHSFLIGVSLLLVGGSLLLMSLPIDAGRSDRPGRLFDMLLFMPATCAAALLFGVVDSTALSLLPLYGTLNGLTIAGAASLAVFAALGAIALQFPISWLAKMCDTRQALIAISALAMIATASMPFALQIPFAGYLVAFVLGGLVEGLFTVTLIGVSRDRRKNCIAQINASLIAIVSLGEVVGPAASSVAFDYAGANGIVMVTVVAFLILAVPLIILRIRERRLHA